MAVSIFLMIWVMSIAAPVLYFLDRRKLFNDKTQFDKHKYVVLGFYHYSFYYVMERNGSIVTQKWILHEGEFDKRTKNLNSSERKKQFEKHKYTLKKLNRSGVPATNRSSTVYAGIVQYKLAANSGDDDFTVEDFERFRELRGKCSLLNAVQHYKAALTAQAWNNAFFRRDFYYHVNGLTFEEDDELMWLITRKMKYTDKVLKKGVYSIFEDAFMYIRASNYASNFKPDFGEYSFEFELADHKEKPPYWTDQHDNVLSKDMGVYIAGNSWYPSQGHFLTVGKTRSGKGTNLIIPHLLQPEKWDGSQVILDIKGELTAITARYLKEQGKKVIIIDPWDRQGQLKATHGIPSSRYNPLDFLNQDHPEFVDDCMEVGASLVAFDKTEKEDGHWTDRARQWVSDYVFHMVTSSDFEDVNLRTLRSMFTRDEYERMDMFQSMRVSGHTIIEESGAHLADMFNNSDREAQSILSTVLRAIDIFKSPILEKTTAQSDFDINSITDGNHVVFINIPPDRIATHFRWLRLIVGSIIRIVLRNPPEKRVLMLLDEFPRLGRFTLIEKTMGLMAGYNLSLWVIAQGIDQIRSEYPDSWETFVNNVAVSTWLGLDGNENPEYLSKLLGTRHVIYKSDDAIIHEITKGEITPAKKLEIRSQTPAQIRTSEYIYTLVSGLEPIAVDKEPYYENWLKERADKDPYHKRNTV